MRRRWTALGLVLMAGLLAWLVWMPEPAGRGATEASAVVSAPVSAPSELAGALAEPGASAPAVAAAAQAAATPAMAQADLAARAAAQRDAVGGCGPGRPSMPSWASSVVDAAAAAAGQVVDRLAGQSRAAREAEAAAAAASAVEDMTRLQPRARGLLVQLAQGGPLAKAAARVLTEALDELAKGEAAQTAAASTLSRDAAASGVSDALQLARDSGSLPVLRLALGLCQQRRSCGDAPGLLLQGWAQQEPDNASPWLLLAEQAQGRGDAQAADDAMYRASQATRMDSHVMSQLAVLAEPAFDVAAGAAGAQLQILWIGIVMAQPLTEPSVVQAYCQRKRLGDSNVAQRCDALARLLVEREGTLLGLMVGRGLGERLGWAADRLAAIDERRLAVQQRSIQSTTDMDPLACRQQAVLRQEMLGVARHGEVGQQLVRMAAAGETQATLAAAARARESAMMSAAREAAAQEARAASAASAAGR